jgi:hypothetical protein
MKSGTSPKLAADHVEKASFFEAPRSNLAARSIDIQAFRFRGYRLNRFIVDRCFHFEQTSEIGL